MFNSVNLLVNIQEGTYNYFLTSYEQSWLHKDNKYIVIMYPVCIFPRGERHRTRHQSEWWSGDRPEPQWPSSAAAAVPVWWAHTPHQVGAGETCQSQRSSEPFLLQPKCSDKPGHGGLCPDWTDSPEKWAGKYIQWIITNTTVHKKTKKNIHKYMYMYIIMNIYITQY